MKFNQSSVKEDEIVTKTKLFQVFRTKRSTTFNHYLIDQYLDKSISNKNVDVWELPTWDEIKSLEKVYFQVQCYHQFCKKTNYW